MISLFKQNTMAQRIVHWDQNVLAIIQNKHVKIFETWKYLRRETSVQLSRYQIYKVMLKFFWLIWFLFKINFKSLHLNCFLPDFVVKLTRKNRFHNFSLFSFHFFRKFVFIYIFSCFNFIKSLFFLFFSLIFIFQSLQNGRRRHSIRTQQKKSLLS